MTKKAHGHEGKKDVACTNCHATNPHDFTFCFACKVPRGTHAKKKSGGKKAKKKAA